MSAPGQPPLDREQLIQLGFIEARGRALDVAAFLDRVQRATPAAGAPADALADERVAKAMADVRARIKGHLERMVDRLGVDVVAGEAKPRRFHDSMIETGFELCDLVKGLNIVGDNDLEAARASLESCLAGVSVRTKKSGAEMSVADTLREDMQQRSAVKSQVESVLNKFNW